MKRIVTVGKEVIQVKCGPRTSLSNVLYLAAEKASKKDAKAKKKQKAA